MAPSVIVDDDPSFRRIPKQKPTLYILSEFHPQAVRHAQELFDCILHTDPKLEDLQQAPQLRAIGKQGVGLDQIDTVSCTKRGVRVFNTPGVNAVAVAEMVTALTLNVARDVSGLWYRQMALGETIRKETCHGLLLTGKTTGIIGMGNIGRQVARMFQAAFNTRIIAFDPFVAMDAWADMDHRRVLDLESLLRDSDVVSIHVPLTPETRHLIAYPQFQQMKRTAILVNAARGGIVHEDHLCRALDEGLIWGCGVDCHEQEPPTKAKYQRLWQHQHYVGTPHTAAATDETQIATTNAAIDYVYDYIVNA